MNIKQGEIVTLQHYTCKDFCKGVVLGYQKDKLSVKPQRECTVFSYFTYDPLVLGIGSDEEVYMLECTITSINYNSNYIDLKIDNTYSLYNKRTDERYPTSIYGVIVHSPIKGSVYIKNISPLGISIKSKADIKEGENLEIEAYVNRSLLNVGCNVIWKKTLSADFEYGLKIVSPSNETTSIINSYLDSLYNEQLNALNNIQNDFRELTKIRPRMVRNL